MFHCTCLNILTYLSPLVNDTWLGDHTCVSVDTYFFWPFQDFQLVSMVTSLLFCSKDITLTYSSIELFLVYLYIFTRLCLY